MVKKIVKDFLYERESYLIRGAVFEVWRAFKGIFKEKIVENALKKELQNRGFKIESQKRIPIYYKGEKVGTYTPDQIVNDSILIEIKVKPYLTKEDERQFWYYLRGSQYRLGFLINFGSKKLEIKRRIYDKAREKYKNISVNQRPYQRISASTNKGFTLVELLVSIFIIVLMAGIILANYRVGGQQFALQRSANKLAQDIRRAQQMAMSAKEFQGMVPIGYGIRFAQDYNKYVIYADCGNYTTQCTTYHCYDGPGPLTGSDDDPDWVGTPCNGKGEKVEEVTLESGITVDLASNWGRAMLMARVVFIPPDPSVHINWGKCGPPGTPSPGRVCIFLETLPDAPPDILTINLISAVGTKTITVNKAGLIEIQ